MMRYKVKHWVPSSMVVGLYLEWFLACVAGDYLIGSSILCRQYMNVSLKSLLEVKGYHCGKLWVPERFQFNTSQSKLPRYRQVCGALLHFRRDAPVKKRNVVTWKRNRARSAKRTWLDSWATSRQFHGYHEAQVWVTSAGSFFTVAASEASGRAASPTSWSGDDGLSHFSSPSFTCAEEISMRDRESATFLRIRSR